jgi:hypothetical protein
MGDCLEGFEDIHENVEEWLQSDIVTLASST